MSESTGQAPDLETRVAEAIEVARAEQERWQTQGEQATGDAGKLEATIHLAASKAVLEVLEEVYQPGTHSGA